jgi:hypothetical protein
MIDRVCSLLRIKPPSVEAEGLLLASGPTVPTSGTSGYQPACMFQNTATGALYVNKGTLASCNFTAVTVA